MKKDVEFTVRLSDDLYRRLLYVSAAERRTPNNHIAFLLRQNIAYYERVHGKIKEADLPKDDADGTASG